MGDVIILMIKKRIIDVNVRYFPNRMLNIILTWRTNKEKKELVLSFWSLEKLNHVTQYEDNWGVNKVKHITLWKNYKPIRAV